MRIDGCIPVDIEELTTIDWGINARFYPERFTRAALQKWGTPSFVVFLDQGSGLTGA